MSEENTEETNATEGERPAEDILGSPTVQAAIRQAVLREQKAAEEREQGLKRNHDRLLDEKKRFEKLERQFGSLTDVEKRIKQAEELEHKFAAQKAGLDPDRFSAEVEKAAQAKFDIKRQELSELIESKAKRAQELEAEVEELRRQAHRDFVAKELVLAAIPEDARFVQDGAWDYLIDRVANHTIAQEVDGFGRVARFKVNDALVPGTGPDGLMTAKELLALSRQGKGPISNISFAFTSMGRGSGASTPNTKGTMTASDNWFSMSADEQSKYVEEHGVQAARELIDRSTKK